ncbi:MAG: UDP-3-O-(3-hydroxymyristoyl)glucosamine N-acyltransferase [Gammaproteobacteria bacterium]|nr:UDP-3-O-(3-hydroxymyristoyl)glucosamine N-acyltransferase [Gammaproteobacteria bacterium]
MAHNKSYTLGEIAELLNLKLVGDDQCEIQGLGTLLHASPGQLSFLSNPTYINQLSSTRASAVIVEDRFADACPQSALVSANPYVSFAQASALFADTPEPVTGIHASACVHASARLDDSVSVGPHAVIEADVLVGANSVIGANSYLGRGATLGANCQLYNNVTLYHGVIVGNDAIIHTAAVIGADGFGFAFDGKKSVKIHQLGTVIVGDDVEIGAGTTIDRGAIDDTIIEQGVKIDNQVQIGHNCHIGEHSVICGCTAIAGSVKLGKYCVMGGASGAVGHITIADKVQVSAMSLVSQSIKEAGIYSSGTGHMKTKDWKRNIVRFAQLDSIAKRLKELEKTSDKN